MDTACRFIGNNARDTWITSAVITISLLAGCRAFALPADGEITAGEATISTPSASAMRIEQKSSHAIINWGSFGIGRNEAVNVAQPDTKSILLNRVSGNDPSEIFGTLTANGRIFLVNPNGILFAPGASINVGGLVASTLAINDSDFLSKKYAFFQNGTPGTVVNRGALNGGFVALLGNSVMNSGSIITTRGTTGIAAGERITLDVDPCGLVAIKVEQTTYNAQITNSGVIEADDGTVVISAPAADMLLASVVNNSGQIRAAGMTERDGSIVIECGTMMNTGTLTGTEINARVNNLIDAGIWNANSISRGGHIQIDATGRIEQTAASHITADGTDGGDIHFNAGAVLYLSGTLSANGSKGVGGQITVTATQTLLAGSQIEAEGQKGGGSILIGGGWQGKNGKVANAATTMVTKSSKLNANTVESGNGGTVVLWSEHSTTFAGTIEAKGGPNSGNGGQVEVSSHENLAYSGGVVMSAPHGENGLLLLDPRNITIDANAAVPLFSLIPLSDTNPAAGDQHGSGNILELDNGNIIVASPLDDFIATDAGAVRLYKPDGTLLSILCGSSANDMVGETVIALTDKNHAVTATRKWSNAGQASVGAVTWINGSTGVSGMVSEANSLVGSTTNDGSSSQVTTLTNNHYVISTPGWDNGAAADAGAVTWGDGFGGTVGIISSANSLTGSTENDGVGIVTALTNGNYVVSSLLWDKGTLKNAGAVTWSNGHGGTVGSISAANSLVGTKSGDQVGSVTALSNGNYVVSAPGWDNGALTNAGMATLVNGLTGAVGTINAANSLVGSKKDDKVGSEVTALSNDNYVVVSSSWDNGSTVDAGAATWGNGVSGAVGAISAANSLVGSATGDLASAHVTALTNGHFVLNSPVWDNGSAADVGAVTWGSGIGNTVGAISASNSLVGSTTKDALASTVTALSNGHFVVASPCWDNGLAVDVGAVTWGNGLGGTVGAISTANSLVGSTANDGTRLNITPLTNGNYVVGAPFWDNGSAINAGAVTWGNGPGGTTGFINAANSLVGSTKNDYAGSDDSGSNNVIALKNGNYIVSSTEWDKETTANTGAVTWGNGLGGTVGTISTANSLVGSKGGDHVGKVTALPNGSYVVSSPLWNGSLTDVGAVTLLSGLGSTAGTISSSNSLLGSNKGDQLGIGGITPLMIGSMDGSFVVSSFTSSNKTGKVDILTPIRLQESVLQEYSFNAGTDNTLNPGQITALLNAGVDLILKANNDITINSDIIANNPLGNGGNLDLNAGKSILVNANITTDNGNLTMVANDRQANGVVDAWRLAGNAAITMAPGTTIDAGTGNVTVELRDGAGLSNRESGDITLRTITADAISAVNHGPTADSGITLASGTLTASASSGSSIILAGQDFINSSGSILSTTGTGRWIVYSGNSDRTIKGGLKADFHHYDANYSSYPPFNVSESGNGFVYIGIPSLTDPLQTWLTDAQHSGQKVVTGETIVNSFYRTINAINRSNTIQQRSVRKAGNRLENSGFLAGNTIEVPEASEAFFIFPIPVNLFSHSNPDAVISLEVQSVNGSSIPFWMSFDPKRKVISGIPPKEAKGVYRIELVAKDQFGDHARSIVLIKIG
jgi:filamentous hemagglutinin family protein